MTVKKMAAISRYIGLSTDTKPTSCPVGSTFKEYDSKDRYVTPDGGTTWSLQDQDDPLLAHTGIGMGRTYYVNNISGDAANSGLSWGSAFAQPSEAIAASETYRELGSGTPGVTTNDYVSNTIAIQGTGTAYTGITDLGERCYIFGVSAGLHRDGGSGQVRIGAADTDGCDDNTNCRGNTIYNIQFMGGGANYAFRNTAWIQRCRFQDVGFIQAAAGLLACFYATNMSGTIMERCTFESQTGPAHSTYGFQWGAASSSNLIKECLFAVGTTALVALAAGNHVNSVFDHNWFMPGTAAVSAIGFYDLDLAGYAALTNNFFASTTQITDRIDRLVDGRTAGNLAETGYINSGTE